MNCSPRLDETFDGWFERHMELLAHDIQRSTLATAARVAELYGAPPEAVKAILMLQRKGSGERTQ